MIKSAKIYLLTSFSEKFPVSLLEGMSTKCAFVSTNVGIVKYLPGGIIANSREELVNALNSFSDCNKLKEYSKKAYDFANENSRIDVQVKKLEKIINEIENKLKL